MTDWHHISVHVAEDMSGFFVTCSCGWKSDFHPAPSGLENWKSAQDAADADKLSHARHVSPDNAAWTRSDAG